MASVLVTGGAGYIGSHVVKRLLEKGYNVVTYDNFETGHEKAVLGGIVVKGDIADQNALEKVMNDFSIEAVIHLAGYSLVSESMEKPEKYYANNVVNGLNLLNTMLKCGVNRLVFSSSAAVYGEPVQTPINEKHPTNPTNTYGETKLMFEQILKRYYDAYCLNSISLRYFNAAGADPSGEIGEDHNPETHLIPLVLQVAQKKRQEIMIYGNDYPTPDGTCIRDYIHVNDLAEAHVLALEALEQGVNKSVYNLGNGKGYSVLEVVNAVESVTGCKVPAKIVNRRLGDPAVLVASSDRISQYLGWKPKINKLEDIIETAWKWILKNPEGYKG